MKRRTFLCRPKFCHSYAILIVIAGRLEGLRRSKINQSDKRTSKLLCVYVEFSSTYAKPMFNPIPSGLFEGGSAWGGGGGGRKVPAAYNSKTINDNEMKLAGVVKDH